MRDDRLAIPRVRTLRWLLRSQYLAADTIHVEVDGQLFDIIAIRSCGNKTILECRPKEVRLHVR